MRSRNVVRLAWSVLRENHIVLWGAYIASSRAVQPRSTRQSLRRNQRTSCMAGSRAGGVPRRGSAISAFPEQAADRGPGAQARQLRQRARQRDREPERRIAARLEGGALAAGDVLHGTAGDRA